jgi:putative hemolysin
LAVDIDALDQLVAAQEPDGRGVPILVRHYAKMGARFVSANKDPLFSDVLDLLIEVDLDRTDPRRIRRFMGPASGAYLDWPSSTSPSR